jgi:chromosome segregation ATPase
VQALVNDVDRVNRAVHTNIRLCQSIDTRIQYAEQSITYCQLQLEEVDKELEGIRADLRQVQQMLEDMLKEFRVGNMDNAWWKTLESNDSNH